MQSATTNQAERTEVQTPPQFFQSKGLSLYGNYVKNGKVLKENVDIRLTSRHAKRFYDAVRIGTPVKVIR